MHCIILKENKPGNGGELLFSFEVDTVFPLSLLGRLWFEDEYSSEPCPILTLPSIPVLAPEFDRFLPCTPLEHAFSRSDEDEWKISFGSCNWEAIKSYNSDFEYNFYY